MLGNILPASIYTGHFGQSSTGPSPRLWGKLADVAMNPDGSGRLVLVTDDFSCMTGALSTGAKFDTGANHYDLHREDTTNHTIVIASDEKGGVLQLAVDSGAGGNEEIGIELGDQTGQLGQISDTAGDAHVTAFECRVKWKAVTTGATWTNGEFVSAIGLLGPGSNDGNVLTDTSGIPTAANHGIGFHVPADDANTINFFYEAASPQTRVDAISDIGAPVDDTFIKLGFLYNPAATDAKRISVYVDNVEQGTYVTATNIATATFPDAEALNFVAATKVITASKGVEMSLDWWAFAQVIA